MVIAGPYFEPGCGWLLIPALGSSSFDIFDSGVVIELEMNDRRDSIPRADRSRRDDGVSLKVLAERGGDEGEGGGWGIRDEVNGG